MLASPSPVQTHIGKHQQVLQPCSARSALAGTAYCLAGRPSQRWYFGQEVAGTGHKLAGLGGGLGEGFHLYKSTNVSG